MSRERHVVFFYSRESDVRRSSQRGRVRPDESQTCSVQQSLDIHQNTVCWYNLKVVLNKGLQFYQPRSNAIILYNTLPERCVEKVVCIKSREEVCNKAYQSPRSPQRGVLKPNLYHGRQDSSYFEARTSVDHQSKQSEEYGENRGDSNSYGGTVECEETRSGNIDFRNTRSTTLNCSESGRRSQRNSRETDPPI